MDNILEPVGSVKKQTHWAERMEEEELLVEEEAKRSIRWLDHVRTHPEALPRWHSAAHVPFMGEVERARALRSDLQAGEHWDNVYSFMVPLPSPAPATTSDSGESSSDEGYDSCDTDSLPDLISQGEYLSSRHSRYARPPYPRPPLVSGNADAALATKWTKITLPAAGQTDGERVEAAWASVNLLAHYAKVTPSVARGRRRDIERLRRDSSTSFNASSSSRPARRNPDAAIHYEVNTDDLVSDCAIYISNDGKCASARAVNIGLKRLRVEPTDLRDEYSNWNPLPDQGDTFYNGGVDGEGRDRKEGEEGEEGEDGENVTGDKRKAYLSSTQPNLLWRRRSHIYMDEMLCHEGLADDLVNPRCGCCQGSPERSQRLLRCTDCGKFLQCKDCVLERHALLPLHKMKEWNGQFWVAVSLDALSFVFQLGHGSLPCLAPDPTARTTVVMHGNGFCFGGWYPATTINPATCATFEVLDLYRLLNVIGNINVHDFVAALERLTDATRVTAVPDRYKAFGRMTRQYAYILRMMRAGLAHQLGGLAAAEKGSAAVPCWTCPQDGKNLPPGWRDVDPEFRFLYMLILAVDANFHLKNRIREREVPDPSFAPGMGYVVDDEPYKEHLKDYVAEKDVSTCIAFAALMQKDTRMTTGLRVSGVGGVVCARHELVRPWAIFKKGSVSYDITCQWRVNLLKRMADIPEHLRLKSDVVIQYGLPVWHAAAHESSCQVQNSLTYLDGVGRTDGEGIERVWSGLNPLAWATKEMGAGARHDALEDRIDHHNWEKNINQGTTLARKLVVAMEERDTQVAAFNEVDSTLRKALRKEWKKIVTDWKADKTKRNPYEMEGGRHTGPSETDVRLDLKNDELAESGEARTVLRKGATACLVAGMQLEDLQHRIKAEKKGRALLVADQDSHVKELHMSFESKLGTFRRLQAVHMPPAVTAIEDEDEARDADEPPPLPEEIKLWMPSQLKETERKKCAKGLAGREARLHIAQCQNALDALRNRLHTKRHLILHRNLGVVGQRAATRSNTLISVVGERIETISAKYRRGHTALKALKAAEWCSTNCRELKPADVTLDEEQDKDVKARERLGLIGGTGRRSRNAPSKTARASKTFSWIWTASGGPEGDVAGMHDSIRVEWSKALARKDRWEEEVKLLREEMRRVMRFLQWRALWWEGLRRGRGDEISPQLRAGVEAYAARQAALHRAISRRFKTGWSVNKADVVRTAAYDALALMADGLPADVMEVFTATFVPEAGEDVMDVEV
ncbi:hypothetical protein C8R43DRAFT_1128520 [Mycena crocata]|nr:hypothetical protein C8R43DRAFT_1128520 [Mycena crocata]